MSPGSGNNPEEMDKLARRPDAKGDACRTHCNTSGAGYPVVVQEYQCEIAAVYLEVI